MNKELEGGKGGQSRGRPGEVTGEEVRKVSSIDAWSLSDKSLSEFGFCFE